VESSIAILKEEHISKKMRKKEERSCFGPRPGKIRVIGVDIGWGIHGNDGSDRILQTELACCAGRL
jgi:hypothetical protein